jgi:hypothetical protein
MRSRLLFILLVVALMATVACSGGSSSPTTNLTTTPTVKPSVVQVTIGDDPADRVASLSITINSVTLTSISGSTVTLVLSPTTVEISSLAGTTTPLGTVEVAAGTYKKATISLGGATITVVDPSNGTTVQKTFPAPANPFNINLNPVFVSDGTALVINLDMDLHASVAIDSNGNITFNPLFIASHGKMVGPPIGTPPNPFTGGVERALGTVTATTGSTFTITTAVGQRSLTFTTNTSTVFKNVSGIAGLQTGMLVMVGGQAQSDGSLLAVGVMVVNGLRNATGAIGIVAKTTGTPVTQFILLARGVTSSTMPAGVKPVPDMAVTVNVTNTTVFAADTDGVDMTGVSLTFDASTLSPAQVVEVDAGANISVTSGTIMGMLPVLGTLTAAQVQLEQQPVTGTISNLTANSFTLTVPTDGVFATLTKTPTITVYKQAGTTLRNSLVLANGQKVVVRGLLFNNSGYKMVATGIGLLQ